MSPRYDEGEIVAQESLKILPQETAPELENRLAHLGSKLLVKTIPEFIAAEITPKPQDLNVLKKYYTKKLSRQDGFIPWNILQTALNGKAPPKAVEITRMTRAFFPWPGVWTSISGKSKEKNIRHSNRPKRTAGLSINSGLNTKLAERKTRPFQLTQVAIIDILNPSSEIKSRKTLRRLM